MLEEGRYHLKSAEFTLEPEDESRVWECDWLVRLIDEPDKVIGRASFAGEKGFGTVPLHVEIVERYRDHGFGTDVFKMMVYWAFLHRDIYEITADCDHENSGAIYAMEKAGFVYRDIKGKTEYYSITKQKTSWTGLYVILGIIVGMVLGIVFSSLWIGLAVGVLVSTIIGAIMDSNANAERRKVTGKRDN